MNRVHYMTDLIEDCCKAMAQYPKETAFVDPEDRARVIAALIIADAINGLRKKLGGA
jgi:hypothetical protein